MFQLPVFHDPDFTRLQSCPDCVFEACEKDGVAPLDFHALSIYPEYFKVKGEWLLAEESRMDCVAVLDKNGKIQVVEFRNLKKGDLVATGRTEDGSDGIFMYADGFTGDSQAGDTFAFRQGRSRETAFSKDYDDLYGLLRYEKEHGKIVWVMGPACAFDADTRNSLAALADHGYMHALLAGNALATHDLEAAYFGTALGQDVYTQESRPNGHYCHLDLINRARRSGSLEQLIRDYNLEGGIIDACIRNHVNLVLAGSIRDDGPLPPVYADVYKAQDAMRAQVRDATTVIALATTLHTIATGNMTPSYRVVNGVIRPVYFYSVDVSEFPLNKLRDRGSLSSRTLVANVQDFASNLARALCR